MGRSGNRSENLCLLSAAGSPAALASDPKRNRLNQYVCMYSWWKCWGLKALLREYRRAEGATACLLQGVPLLIYDLYVSCKRNRQRSQSDTGTSQGLDGAEIYPVERSGANRGRWRHRCLPRRPAGSEEALTAIAISRLCTNKLMNDNGLLIEGSGAAQR